jgi:microcystin-dependent protein
MADPFVAEIRIFPFNFPPKGWAFCDGQLMPISQNTALFALLGTTYGGDGKSTFALPGLQGSAAMHPGQGSGLSLRSLGEIGGAETITLLVSEMPIHTHSAMVSTEISDVQIPTADVAYGRSGGGSAYTNNNAGLVTMAPQALAPAGSSLPHNNMQPYLTLSFCIALQGVFPPRP